MSEVENRIWSHIPDDGSKARCLAVLENLSKSNDIEAVLAQYQNMQLGSYKAEAITDLFRVHIIDQVSKVEQEKLEPHISQLQKQQNVLQELRRQNNV